MNYDEAVRLLLLHGCGEVDEKGNPDTLDQGFLGMLRPYRGLIESNFHEVMEALFVVGQDIFREERVDRRLVETLWATSRLMRRWGLEDGGMLQRNNLISAEDSRMLEEWIDTFEWTALGFLNGSPPSIQIERYAQYIGSFGCGENVEFFIPILCESIADPSSLDPTFVARALGRIGPRAMCAVATLREAQWKVWAEHCREEGLEAISKAIDLIEGDV